MGKENLQWVLPARQYGSYPRRLHVVETTIEKVNNFTIEARAVCGIRAHFRILHDPFARKVCYDQCRNCLKKVARR